jgi:predicted DCC family thiol-disulfide oxidoreductase YuxK
MKPRKLAVRYPLTIYYDASCPMCASEMLALKDRDAHDRLILIDCSAAGFPDQVEGVSRQAMMELIHARDAGGVWRVGVEVFEAAYRAAGLTWAARLWGNRFLRPLWSRLYPWVARNRQSLSRLGANRLVRRLIPSPRDESSRPR